MNKLRTFGWIFTLALLAIGAGIATSPSPVGAQTANAPWSTIATAGTVDEEDLAIANLAVNSVGIKSSAPLPATVNTRYNIVGLPGLNGSGRDGVELRVLYVDNGPNARVTVGFWEDSLLNASHGIKLSFDSDMFGQQNGHQSQAVSTCNRSAPFSFNFETNAYSLDGEISKTAAAGKAQLLGLQVRPVSCVD